MVLQKTIEKKELFATGKITLMGLPLWDNSMMSFFVYGSKCFCIFVGQLIHKYK